MIKIDILTNLLFLNKAFQHNPSSVLLLMPTSYTVKTSFRCCNFFAAKTAFRKSRLMHLQNGRIDSHSFALFSPLKKQAFMRYLSIIGLALLATLLACGDTPPRDGNEATNGKTIYKRFCIACHGADGQLQLNGARNFRESELSLEERIAIITNGRNMMTPFKGLLNEAEIKAVAAYTIKLTKGDKHSSKD